MMIATNMRSAVKRYKSLAILALLLLAVAIARPSFFGGDNLRNLFLRVSMQGIIGFGMTFCLIAGEFDMSVGSILTLGGIVFAIALERMGFVAALAVTVLTGVLVGLINGTLIARMRLSSFIGTLGAMYAYKGLALIISKGNPIRVVDPTAIAISEFRLFGNTIFPFLFIFAGICSAYVLMRTQTGRNFYAVGGNAEVAKYSGLNVAFYKTLAFVIVGVASALAGALTSIRLQSATSIAGNDINLTVVSSVIIGGTKPSGGSGGAIESFIGLMILAVVEQALDVLGISGYYQQVVQGFLTVAIIGASSYSSYRKVSSV